MNDRKTPRSRADYGQFQTLQTRWNDNDQFGHLYNVAYYEFFDEAINRVLMAHGMLDQTSGDPIQVVVENGCLYFRELSYPDIPTIGLRLDHLGRSSIRIEAGMFRNDEDLESARAHFTLVTVDHVTHRPVPTPPEQRAAMQTLLPPRQG